MAAFTRLSHRVRALFFRSAVERDLDREMRFHLEAEAEKNQRLGMPPREAKERARAVFGSVDAAKEAHRDGRGTRVLEDFLGDVGLALRSLRRNPGFAAAAIITLMLGIGANVAIFTAVNAVLIRPLPYTRPDRLVMLWEANKERGWVNQTAAPANMFDWAEQVRSFDGVGAYASFATPATLTGAGEPEQFGTLQVTGNLFRVLGVTPAAGQLFRDEQTWRTGELTAMISYRLWRDRFGKDPALPGSTIKLNGRDVRVVGVLPQNFEIPGVDVDIWRPTAFDPAQKTQTGFRMAHWLRPVARLKRGVTVEQADADMQVTVKRLQEQYPRTNTGMEGGLTELHSFLSGSSKRPLLILLSAVGALLLIACANVGNLLLVQASGRAHETALRLALGARRARLIRHALTESLVLATLGGITGCAVGYWATQLLASLRPADLISGTIAMNWMVIAYVAGITIVSSLLFGLAPILWGQRNAPSDTMRESGRGGTGRNARRWSELLIISEVALALMLTLSAGLLVRSFSNLGQLDAGIHADGVMTAKISLPGARYDSIRKVVGFWDGLLSEARSLPGVTAAGAVSQLPLTTASWSSDFKAEAWPAEKFGVDVLHRDSYPGYFAAMGVPLLRGRDFDRTDIYENPRVVIVNQDIAKMFGDADPVGQRIAFSREPDSTAVWYTIVGVVGSERQSTLALPARPEIFQPTAQRVDGTLVVTLRTSGGKPEAIVPAFREMLKRHDPNLALADVRTMRDVRSDAAARERFMAVLLLAFAGVGLCLAVVGVYGVMARVARGRSREMGIRVALGAQVRQVRWLVIERGLRLAGAGIVIGVGGAVFATRALQSLLFGVEPFDLPTFALVSVALAVAAFVACWIPAMRATKADAMHALRAE